MTEQLKVADLKTTNIEFCRYPENRLEFAFMASYDHYKDDIAVMGAEGWGFAIRAIGLTDEELTRMWEDDFITFAE